MRTRILALFTVFIATSLLGCSSPQKTEDESNVQTTAPKPDEPECFKGCMLNSDGKCTLEGNVMDWSSTDTETIECDPRCCKPGAVTESGAADIDGDGVYDDADQCPDAKEDMDGFQDEDGCPDPDNDGDGIADDDDLCPLDAEDVDGYQDDDGCLDAGEHAQPEPAQQVPQE
jgi:hypothetical protein